MTTDLDAQLREALRRLASEPAPAGLAEAAMRRGRHQRRTTAVLGTVAAVAAVAMATPVVLAWWPGGVGSPSPEVAVRPERTPEQTPSVSTPAEQGRPRLVVVAYSDPRTGFFRLLDRDTGEYVEMPYAGLALSPDRTRLLVQGGRGTLADPYRVGVFDLETRDVVGWVNGYIGPANWSPNGQEFVVSRSSQSGGSGFAIVDANTFTFHDVSFLLNGQPMVWTPDGEQLAITITEPVSDERLPDRVVGINVYDRAGQLQRTLPVDLALHATTDFSPDGTVVALYDYFDTTVKIVDVASGAVRYEITLADRVADNLGWLDDSHLLLHLWREPDEPRHLAVVDLTGTIVETVDLPEEMERAEKVWVGLAEGLSDAAARLAF